MLVSCALLWWLVGWLGVQSFPLPLLDLPVDPRTGELDALWGPGAPGAPGDVANRSEHVKRKSLISFIWHKSLNFFLRCKSGVENFFENVWHVIYTFFVTRPALFLIHDLLPKKTKQVMLFFKKKARYIFSPRPVFFLIRDLQNQNKINKQRTLF